MFLLKKKKLFMLSRCVLKNINGWLIDLDKEKDTVPQMLKF